MSILSYDILGIPAHASCIAICCTWLVFCSYFRFLYRFGENSLLLGWFNFFCDNSDFGELLDGAPNNFKEKFIPTGLLWLFISVTIAASTLVVIAVIVFICIGGWRIIPEIPHAIWIAVLYIGWFVFESFSFVGMCLEGAIYGIGVAAEWTINGVAYLAVTVFEKLISAEFWSAIGGLLISVGKLLLVVISLTAACVALMFVGTRIITSKAINRFITLCEMTANGFSEARKRRQKKRLAKPVLTEEEMVIFNAKVTAKRAKEEQEIAVYKKKMKDLYGDDYIYFIPSYWGGKYNPNHEKAIMKKRQRQIRLEKNPTLWMSLGKGTGEFLATLGTLIKFCAIKAIGLYGHHKIKMVTIDNDQVPQEVFELGPLGVIIKGLWSLKKGACPLLEFADDDDLDDVPQIASNQKNDPDPQNPLDKNNVANNMWDDFNGSYKYGKYGKYGK